MRKLLITFSALLLVAAVNLNVANAQTQDVKKAEAKKECCKAATGKECPMMASAKTDDKKPCCKEMATADSKEAAACKTKTEAGCCKGMTAETKDAKKCDPAKCPEMAKK